MLTNNNLSGSVLTTDGNGTFTTTISNTQYNNIVSNYTFQPTYQPTPFSINFSWNNKSVDISLKNGDDIFKLANAFMEWLDENEIEYNVKTNRKKKK